MRNKCTVKRHWFSGWYGVYTPKGDCLAKFLILYDAQKFAEEVNTFYGEVR